MNVTPEREAPTIPNATKYQGELRFATKKVSLLAPFPVIKAIPIKEESTPKISDKINVGVIIRFNKYTNSELGNYS